MSRSGYSDDFDNWELIKYRGMVASATRGKRGQALLQALADALDAMPEKRLIVQEIQCEDGVCALGSLAVAREMDTAELDPYDPEGLAQAFDVATPLIREIEFENDEGGRFDETPERRWSRMRSWVASNLAARQHEKEPQT